MSKYLLKLFLFSLLLHKEISLAQDNVGAEIQNLYLYTQNNEKKFVWFWVPKVATSTLRQILKDNDIKFEFPGIWRHWKPEIDSEYQRYFKFAFVRNPWSRVLSCYLNKVVTKVSKQFSECFDKDFDYFIDFIDRQDLKTADSHIRLQTELLPMNELDFIGRLETFSEDLFYVLTIIGLNVDKIPHQNTSKHQHYSKYYNQRTKDIIAKKYQVDIEAFGYSFETNFK